MVTFLLVIIAVLLFVLASKFAPEELNSLWPILGIGVVIYLIIQYWEFILAIPFAAFYGFQWFVNTDFFAWASYTFAGFALIVGIYFGVKYLANFSRNEGLAGWLKLGRGVLKGTGLVLLYSVIGTIGLIALMFFLIFIFVR